MRVDAGGHALRVETVGAAPPDFVCLHGLADAAEVWSAVAPALAARGRVVTLDQRAHGESDAPPGPYSREDLAADVVRVLDRLGIERAIVVGHSMGGIVAMTAALRNPERVAALVLLGSASQASERVAGWYERIATAAETDGLEGIRRAIFGERSRRALRGDARGLASFTRCLKSLNADPLTPKLAALRCPTLVLVGENDPMGAAASSIIAGQVPAATLETVPGRGHWLHVECPEVVVAAIDRFLAARR